uniref:VWFA domain-containing protein n=1 Tax=Oryzias melastigma TaxID=30732 RepID=A0A3B3D3V8_ORYME
MNAHLERDTASRRVPRFLIVVTGGEATDEVKGPAEALRQKDVTGFAGSSKRDFQKMKDLLKSVISMFTLGPDDVRVGVMQLGGNRGLEFGLNKYFSSEEMLGAVDRMQPVEGGNRLGRSLTEVSKYLEAAGGGRPGLKQSLVVITDLWSIDEVRGPASALRAREVEIYAVGVLEASRKQLLEITHSWSLNPPSTPSSAQIVPGCSFLLKFSGSALAPPTAKCCMEDTTLMAFEAVADIVFLVDGSWSIGTENFEQIRRFLSTLVSSFDVSPDHVRIGLVQYSSDSRTEFLLRTFQNKEDVLRSITKLPYKGGGTMTGKGLDFLLNQHFVEAAGSRASSSVPQIAVVITDGKSQDEVKTYAEKLQRRGIILYAIGIRDADTTQLKEIAESRHVYSVSDFSALQDISQSIVQTLCTTVGEAKRQLGQLSPGNTSGGGAPGGVWSTESWNWKRNPLK